MHGAVYGQATLRAGVVTMLPGDLSSPSPRLASAEKRRSLWSRLPYPPLHGTVIREGPSSSSLMMRHDGEVRHSAHGANGTERERDRNDGLNFV